MRYVGSKAKYAKELLPIILADRKPGQWYVEPFAGGMNLIDKVEGNRLANDANPYLIALYLALQSGYSPPDFVSEWTYKDIQNNPTHYADRLIGFVGFGCSFGGKWFGGYARGNKTNGESRNYADESRRHLLKQAETLAGVRFSSLDYQYLPITDTSVIYCDPPYQGTVKYKDGIDYDQFWQWVRNKKAEGHTIFVSEYNAPKDFTCVWQKEVYNTLDKNTAAKKGIERLFTL